MKVSRRKFIKMGITTGGALFVYFAVPLKVRKGWRLLAKGPGKFTHHYFMVTPENAFIFTMDKSEMGQGVITGQTTLFGEEVDIPPWAFQVEPAPVADVFGTMNGLQFTGGSTSTNQRWLVLRQAGANIRQLMLNAAARKWGVPAKDLETRDGVVVHPRTGNETTYAALIEIAAGLDFPQNTPLKNSKEFKYIGKDFPHADAEAKSLGSTAYGIDVDLPGLKVAVVERSPVYGAKDRSYNRDAMKSLPGVVDVFEISTGVALVCNTYWQAENARKKLVVEWDSGAQKSLSSQEIRKSYINAMDSGSGKSAMDMGDIARALASADRVIEAEYYLPYLAHSCMEPMNCTAWVQANRCDVYSPNQGPTMIRNWAAAYLGMAREDVKVHTSKFLGGGFGRRGELDFSREAVEVSAKLNLPVKVMWSREDDTRHSPMRPMSVHKLRGAIKGKGAIAWEHKLGSESVIRRKLTDWIPTMMPGWIPGSISRGIGGAATGLMRLSGSAPTMFEGARIDYAIPNRSLKGYTLDIDIPIAFWRSVGHSYTGFVVESFIDELAHAAGRDPFEFRRDLLPEGSRKRQVLELVAKRSGWNRPLPKGRYRGIAVVESFQSFVAQVAEVEVVQNRIQVKKVHCAVDCGVAVNPGVIRKQMESGIIFGLSAAFYGEITIKDGRVEQENFNDYPILRMSETPEIEVYITESREHPTGVGEPGLPPIAAAVGNAVYLATGQRLRELPFRLREV